MTKRSCEWLPADIALNELEALRPSEINTLRWEEHELAYAWEGMSSFSHPVRTLAPGERAYAIWDAGGRGNGNAEQHWLAAEREILAQMTAESPASRPVKAVKTVRQRRPLTNIQP